MLRIFASFIAIGVLLSAKSPEVGRAARIGTVHGTLRIAIDVEPDTLVPELTTSNLLGQLSPLMFDQLVTIDNRGEFIPVLARFVPTSANGGISNKGRTITFHLRHDVRWHDGIRFTSRDVSFTQRVIDNPVNPIASEHVVEKVDAPNLYTVVFHLKRSDATALLDLGYFILPEHLLRNVSNLRTSDFNSHPVGTGPFRFLRWARADRIELSANRAYFLRKPGLRLITILILPSADSEYAALVAGSIDWVITSGPRALKTYNGLNGLRAVEVPRYTWYGIALNLQHPPLDDVRVRRALSLAIDRSALAKVYLGSAVPAGGDVPNFSWAYNSAAKAPKYDLAAARALMRQAGWADRGDGRLSNGWETLDLRLTSVPFFEDIDVQLQAQLRLLGVRVDVRTSPLNLYYGFEGVLQKKQFDLGVIGSFNDPDPGNASYLACDRTPPGGHNYSRYCDRRMNSLLASSVQTEDHSVRKRWYALIEAKIAHDLPYIYLLWPKATTLVNADLHGFLPGPGSYTWNVSAWSI